MRRMMKQIFLLMRRQGTKSLLNEYALHSGKAQMLATIGATSAAPHVIAVARPDPGTESVQLRQKSPVIGEQRLGKQCILHTALPFSVPAQRIFPMASIRSTELSR
jgi:hypothetical protein